MTVKLKRDALPVWERVIGSENAKTLMVVGNLANVKDPGRYAEAEELERGALDTEAHKRHTKFAWLLLVGEIQKLGCVS